MNTLVLHLQVPEPTTGRWLFIAASPTDTRTAIRN